MSGVRLRGPEGLGPLRSERGQIRFRRVRFHELSEFFGPHRVTGRKLSEFLPGCCWCAKASSPSFSQNSPSSLQNSVSSLLRNSTLKNSIHPVSYQGPRFSNSGSRTIPLRGLIDARKGCQGPRGGSSFSTEREKKVGLSEAPKRRRFPGSLLRGFQPSGSRPKAKEISLFKTSLASFEGLLTLLKTPRTKTRAVHLRPTLQDKTRRE